MEQTPEQASAEAIHKTKNAQAAVENARHVHLESLLSSDKFKGTIEDAVLSALGRGSVDKKFVDVGRIPFICDDIRSINQLLTLLNDRFTLIQRIVFGFVSAILLGTVTLAGIVILNYLHSIPQ